MSEGLLAWQMKTTNWSGFTVVSEGDTADYVESVDGGAFVSNEGRWKTEDEGGDK